MDSARILIRKKYERSPAKSNKQMQIKSGELLVIFFIIKKCRIIFDGKKNAHLDDCII